MHLDHSQQDIINGFTPTLAGICIKSNVCTYILMNSVRLAAVLCHLLRGLSGRLTAQTWHNRSEYCPLSLFVGRPSQNDLMATPDSLLRRQYQGWSHSVSLCSPRRPRSSRRRKGESRPLESVAILAAWANHTGAVSTAYSFCHSRQHSTCLRHRLRCL